MLVFATLPQMAEGRFGLRDVRANRVFLAWMTATDAAVYDLGYDI